MFIVFLNRLVLSEVGVALSAVLEIRLSRLSLYNGLFVTGTKLSSMSVSAKGCWKFLCRVLIISWNILIGVFVIIRIFIRQLCRVDLLICVHFGFLAWCDGSSCCKSKSFLLNFWRSSSILYFIFLRLYLLLRVKHIKRHVLMSRVFS